MHRLGAPGILCLLCVLTLASCDRAPGRIEAVASASAHAVGVGRELDARDEGGHELHFRVDGVEKNVDDQDGDVSFYELSVNDGSGEWSRYCSADYEGKSRAIP